MFRKKFKKNPVPTLREINSENYPWLTEGQLSYFQTLVELGQGSGVRMDEIAARAIEDLRVNAFKMEEVARNAVRVKGFALVPVSGSVGNGTEDEKLQESFDEDLASIEKGFEVLHEYLQNHRGGCNHKTGGPSDCESITLSILSEVLGIEKVQTLLEES